MNHTLLTLPLPELAGQFLLRSGMTFLNHGSFGACPRPVFAVYQQWQRELEEQPVEFLGRRISDLLAAARARLGAWLGVGGDDLAFVPNATHGINIVARSLALRLGDEVLGSDHEYGAVERTWRFICTQRSAIYISRPITLPLHDPAAIVEQFWAGVTPRTRVIVLSHITSPTALILPVAEICRRARDSGIISVIDGAHAPGQIPLDLAAIGADFYAGNCHKWLCAPKGAGFLYARPAMQSLLQPLVVSWGWQSEQPGISPFVDYFEWTGTADPAAYLSVPAAIDFQEANQWPQVRAACHALLRAAGQRIGELSGLPPISPAGSDWWVQMASFRLPPCEPRTLKQRLWDEFQIEVPIVVWHGQPFIRVSIQAYNRPEDIDRLLEALKYLL